MADEKNNSGGGGSLTYGAAGVDISYTDSIKRGIAAYVNSDNPRVLNGLGPFASLYDIRFDDIPNPVLVLKSEEPGSKQKLAINHGYTESICHDMINHLVNDIIVMGAMPLAVLDTIVCGKAEGETIKSLVKGISDACAANGCVLVGGETSIQPGVLDEGSYVLTASVAGIVDRSKIIDGSAIRPGDRVYAVASNGLHTNGYTLVRLLMDKDPRLKDAPVGDGAGETFFQAIMKPHAAYYRAVSGLFDGGPVRGMACDMIHGMAHITGGGIEGNLSRVVPAGLRAVIDLKKIAVPRVFKRIKAAGGVADDEMLRTFNCGVGLTIVAPANAGKAICDAVSGTPDAAGACYACYEIGEITETAEATGAGSSGGAGTGKSGGTAASGTAAGAPGQVTFINNLDI